MSHVKIRQILSRSSGFATHKTVNLIPLDVYPVVGAVTVGCLMSVGILYHTATKPNSGIQYKGARLRKNVSKSIQTFDDKTKSYFG